MLGIIVATLFIALIVNIFLKKVHLPTIIGYIVTGTIISYGFNLHEAANNHTLREIAEFGIVFLMFTIGLEFSIKHLNDMRYEVFVVGFFQIALTASIVFLIAHFGIALDTNTSIVASLAVAMSSTAIVLKTFNETGEINKRYGRNALGVLIMQDIAVIPALLLISVLSSNESNVVTIFQTIAIDLVILLAAVYIVGKYLLDPFFSQIAKTHSDELFVGSILFLAIGGSYGAHLLGFSFSLGAFVAGMMIAETRFKHQAEADLIPFRDLLLGVFFVTVGMQINFGLIGEYIYVIGILLVLIMIMKFLIIYAIVRIKNDRRTTLKSALSLVQVGEFALAILELARSNSLVQAPYGQVLTVTIILSMVITPLILKNLGNIADKVIKCEGGESQNMPDEEALENHVVLMGYGEFGKSIAQKLKSDAKQYVIIENNIDRYHVAKQNGEPVIFGNAASKPILNKAYISSASHVIVAVDNPHKQYYICHEIQKEIDYDKIIVKVHSTREKDVLSSLGIDNILVENELTSKAMMQII